MSTTSHSGVDTVSRIARFLTQIISETNGLSLEDTLVLAEGSPQLQYETEIAGLLSEFHDLLGGFRLDRTPIDALFNHPVGEALALFLRTFPIPYREEHIHLTGSLDAAFIYERLQPLLHGPDRAVYEAKISEVYGSASLPIRSAADV